MNIVRLYNQNRKKFWRAIIIIASIIILIQVVNYIVSVQNDTQGINVYSSNVNSQNTFMENSTIETNQSAVSDTTISEERLENVDELLNQFFEYCNNKELDEAYALLTDECKEELYPSVEVFENNYYNNLFNGQNKSYSFRNWSNDTYLVTITENILATGNLNAEGIQDYITISNGKLNINSYIGRKEVNVTNNEEDITITVVSKDTYMDYEIYNIQITNNTENRICMSSTENSNDIYITDDNNVDYGVYNHELTTSELAIPRGATKTISFKFYSSYTLTKEIELITFSDIIANYDEYLDYENKNEYNNLYNIRFRIEN